jgi:ribulose 1,5-bisphosphate synthetase/thiazole synthase
LIPAVWIERDSYLSPETQPAYPKLTSNTDSDVLVVGGGITGLQVAYELLNKGKKVVVIDDGSESCCPQLSKT